MSPVFYHFYCIKIFLYTHVLHQVKPLELTDFLQVKKGEGYCIVGVEQTANSQSLQDYKFPEKTLLLLGYGRIKHFPFLKHQRLFCVFIKAVGSMLACEPLPPSCPPVTLVQMKV